MRKGGGEGRKTLPAGRDRAGMTFAFVERFAYYRSGFSALFELLCARTSLLLSFSSKLAAFCIVIDMASLPNATHDENLCAVAVQVGGTSQKKRSWGKVKPNHL